MKNRNADKQQLRQLKKQRKQKKKQGIADKNINKAMESIEQVETSKQNAPKNIISEQQQEQQQEQYTISKVTASTPNHRAKQNPPHAS